MAGIDLDRILGTGDAETQEPSGSRSSGGQGVDLDRILSGSRNDDGRLVVGSDPLTGQRQFLPSREIASRLARLQANESTRERGLELQRAFQQGLSDADLERAGLSRLAGPSPSLLQRGMSVGSTILNVLDRPSQVVLRSFGSLTGTNDESLGSAIVGGLTSTGERRSFIDNLGLHEDHQNFPGAGLVNFLGTVATDPLTFVTFGAGSVGRRGLRTIGREFGGETAENVARRGITALSESQQRRLPALFGSAQAAQRFSGRARGGLTLDVPFTRTSRTLIPGEAVRRPLRASRIIDDAPRSAARTGIRAADAPATLQSIIRGRPLVQGVRHNFNVLGELGEKFSEPVRQEVIAVMAGARSRLALSTEEFVTKVDNMTTRAFSGLDDATQDALSREMLISLNAGTVTQTAQRLRMNAQPHAADLLEELADEMGAAARTLGQRGPAGSFLPRVPSPSAARALRRSGDSELARFRELADVGDAPRSGTLLAENAQARRITGLTDAEDALELNPGRLVGIQVTRANRSSQLGRLADELEAVVVDPETGQKLVLRDTARNAELAQTLGYRRYALGNDMVWAPPELGTGLTKFQERVLRDPASIESFSTFYDEWLGLWKSMATVPIIFGTGFHARNHVGNLFNNYLAGGIFPRHYHRAQQYQRVMADALADTTAAGARAGSAARRREGLDLTVRRLDDVAPPTPATIQASERGSDFLRPLGPPEPIVRRADLDLPPNLTPREAEELDFLEGILRRPAVADPAGRGALTPDGDFVPSLARLSLNSDQQVRLRELRAQQARPRPPRGVDPETGEIITEFVPGPIDRQIFQVQAEQLPVPARPSTGPRTVSVSDLPEFEDALRVAARRHGLGSEDVRHILHMRDQGVVGAGFFRADLHENALAGLSRAERVNYFRRILADPQQAHVIRMGSDVGQWIESNARVAHYLGKVEEGLDPLSAAMSVKQHLFDYSQLTTFERTVMKRIMPFYTFMRFNTPLQFRNIIEAPRKAISAQRLQEGIAGMAGINHEGENRALPDFALGRGDVPLSSTFADWLAGPGDDVLFGIEFPTQAAFETVEPFIGIMAQIPGFASVLPQSDEGVAAHFRQLVNLPGGGGVEFIKVAVEQAMQQDLFTGAPVDDRTLLESLFQATTPFTSKGQRIWRDLTTSSNDPNVNRLRARLVSSILGLNLTVVDERRERAELFRQLDIVERAIERAKDAGIDVPTLTELRDAGLAPPLSALRD